MTQRNLVVLAGAVAMSALIGCSRGTGQTNEPTPVPDDTGATGDTRTPCDQEIALECPDGMTDGCTRQGAEEATLTAYHVCLPADEQASQPCAQEIARECGEGLTDACLLDPPAASTHVCVQVAALADEPAEPSGPTAPAESDGSDEPADPTDGSADEG